MPHRPPNPDFTASSSFRFLIQLSLKTPQGPGSPRVTCFTHTHTHTHTCNALSSDFVLCLRGMGCCSPPFAQGSEQRAHVNPKLMGNRSVVNRDECSASQSKLPITTVEKTAESWGLSGPLNSHSKFRSRGPCTAPTYLQKERKREAVCRADSKFTYTASCPEIDYRPTAEAPGNTRKDHLPA